MSKTLKRKRGPAHPVSKKRLQGSAKRHLLVGEGALKWKEVALPDRLDDAEGFYGLEEIDDVDIVKDDNGLISFRPNSINDVIVGEGEVGGEEWVGFDEESTADGQELDAAPQTNLVDSASANMVEPVEVQVSTHKSDKKAKKAVKASKVKPNVAETADFEDEIDYNALNGAGQNTEVDVTAWKELDLSLDMLSAISSLGFSQPTPIQRSAIPSIRDGRDVIGKAVTGSGKTLAFGIPIIEKWLETRSEAGRAKTSTPTAFILAPTRELAHQLSKHFLSLSKGLDQSPRIATVTGGLALVKQQRQLEFADIIIGTPGRLWEVINSSHGLVDRLKQIEFLVIDEADRLLSEGHFKEVEEILNVLDRKVIDETDEDADKEKQKSIKARRRQTLVFSATFHKGLQQRLASKQNWRQNESDLLSNSQSLEYLLRKLRFQRGAKPTFVDANPTSSMADNLSESVLECGAMQKDLYLYSLLLLHQHQHTKRLETAPSPHENDKIARTLIFTNAISTVKRLVPLLVALSIPNTTVLPLHSSMPQKARLRSLERFATPVNPTDTSTILIATDVAARGLDIKGVTTIVHYHVPRTADMYVHRSGRTARASASGRSILICSPDETAGVTRLITKVHSDQLKAQKIGQASAHKVGKSIIQPFYLPASLQIQTKNRVSLAQKIADTTLLTEQAKSEDSWLRKAAEELGVDYSSDEFEANSKRMRRGRGAGREHRKKEAVGQAGNVGVWRNELKMDLKNVRLDFGDGER